MIWFSSTSTRRISSSVSPPAGRGDSSDGGPQAQAHLNSKLNPTPSPTPLQPQAHSNSNPKPTPTPSPLQPQAHSNPTSSPTPTQPHSKTKTKPTPSPTPAPTPSPLQPQAHAHSNPKPKPTPTPTPLQPHAHSNSNPKPHPKPNSKPTPTPTPTPPHSQPNPKPKSTPPLTHLVLAGDVAHDGVALRQLGGAVDEVRQLEGTPRRGATRARGHRGTHPPVSTPQPRDHLRWGSRGPAFPSR